MSKYCTVVDKDVDIHDLDDIMWATVLRASPNRDVITLEGIPDFIVIRVKITGGVYLLMPLWNGDEKKNWNENVFRGRMKLTLVIT